MDEKYEYEGSPIQKWDLEHGIYTVRRDGCDYRVCADWPGLIAKCDAEREADFRRKIADQQEQAYFGGAI